MSYAKQLLVVGGSVVVVCVAGCAAGSETDDDGVGGEGGAAPPKEVSAKGISVTDIDFYQAIEVPLVRAGAPASSTVPIVAGKDAYLRVGFTLDPAFAPRAVRLKVTLESASATLEPVFAEVPVNASSTHDSLASTLNVAIPGASLLPDTSYRVDILETDPDAVHTEPAGAPGWPESGTTPLGAQNVGAGTKIVIVPIVYQADGSGRLPDTSEAQIELYRSRVLSMYPTPAINIEMGPEWAYNGPDVVAFGDGWGEILTAFSNAHHGGGSDPTAYYYGLFAPAGSFAQYCSGGCVTGLSFSSDQPGNADARSSVSLGFTGPDFADTFSHELGHAHGQLGHAPCGGAGSVDGNFPYAGGKIGVFGMDVAALSLKDPTLFTDLMGYCDNNWISDYNYQRFFTRTQILAGAALVHEGPPRTWRAYAVRADGSLYDAGTSERTLRPSGETVRVHTRGDRGEAREVEGVYLPADHLPVGMLMVPEDGSLTVESFSPAAD